MTMDNFPNGLMSQGVPVTGSQIPTIGPNNNYWYVSSTKGNAGNPGTSDRPFNSLASACSTTVNGALTANDVIIVLPGHTENVVAAGGITLSTAGVQVIGLGTGSQMPTITFATLTTASWVISGAGVKISGIRGVAGVNSLTTPFAVSGSNVSLQIEWLDSTYEAQQVIVATTVTDLTVNIKHRGLTGGSLNYSSVTLTAVTRADITLDCVGKPGTQAVVYMVTTASTGVKIRGSVYVAGTYTGALNVVDATGTSLYDVSLFDGAAGAWYMGSYHTSPQLYTPNTDSAALYGAGVASWPASAAHANSVSIAAVLGYIQDNVINGTGTALTTNYSLFDQISGTKGVATWPASAAHANGKNIAQVLGYVQDNIINSGTALPASQSIYDLLAGTLGVATWPTPAGYGNGKSIAQVLAYAQQMGEQCVVTSTTNNIAAGTLNLFAVAGGPIYIDSIYAVCTAANNTNASTLYFNLNANSANQALSAASATLASAAIGTLLSIDGTFADATIITAPAAVKATQATRLTCVPGTLQAIVGTATITGTWYFGIRYRPLSPAATVTASF